jgi:hypothetical protein
MRTDPVKNAMTSNGRLHPAKLSLKLKRSTSVGTGLERGFLFLREGSEKGVNLIAVGTIARRIGEARFIARARTGRDCITSAPGARKDICRNVSEVEEDVFPRTG